MSGLAFSVLELPRLRSILLHIAVASAREELPGNDANPTELDVSDLNFALMCASSLTAENEEAAQDAVLRISQWCLRSEASTAEQRAASALLLERVGNKLSIGLAEERGSLAPLDFGDVSNVLALDTLARRGELTLQLESGQEVSINPFQKQFWELVATNDWVSVSAPTSAGKSHIVREWMMSEIAKHDSVQLVYVAPTRALVEEVGDFFRTHLPQSVGVHTLPWDPGIADYDKQIFVFTQERFHLLQERSPGFAPEIIFVDEAQKIAEGTRGILLSQVLDETVQRNSAARLVFASPLSTNPGVLLTSEGVDRTVASIVGETVTVTQNLIYVGQVPRQPAVFRFKLHYQGGEHELGDIRLTTAPDNVGERVPHVAVAVAGLTTGNLVYANGPAEAEKYARLIYAALGDEGNLPPEVTGELVDFAKGVVHERFALAEFAKRGVAFHYGDMPLVLKAKVEELFKRGVLRYLVCTSTLLEGVNLPCRNIFLRGPMKGPRTHMSMGDFWNLAGRAGRWGKEFEGNIFCIDAEKEKVWPERPGVRQRTEIVPAAMRVLGGVDGLLDYINAGGQMASRQVSPELESTYSWLTGRLLGRGQLKGITGVLLEEDSVMRLQSSIAEAANSISLPTELIKKHAGISPLSMQRLYDAVLEHGHPDLLALVPPASDDAFDEYKIALDYVAQYLGGSFEPDARRLSLARLIVHWMRGLPLGVIIENRAINRRIRGVEFNYPQLIRKVMEDVEDIARFEAPRYLSCFSDVVGAAAAQMGLDLNNQILDIEMMLELGVPRLTDMSFIAAGLSRASARAIVAYVPNPNMSPAECIEWLEQADLESLDVPPFAIREMAHQRELLAARKWEPTEHAD